MVLGEGKRGRGRRREGKGRERGGEGRREGKEGGRGRRWRRGRRRRGRRREGKRREEGSGKGGHTFQSSVNPVGDLLHFVHQLVVLIFGL